METINNNSDNEKYTECLTTYDQIIDAAGHLTSQIEFYRERMIKGSIEPSVAKSWIRRYNKAINRFIGFMSTVEIRISEIKGFKRYFIGDGEQKEMPYYTVYVRRRYVDRNSTNNKINEDNHMMTAISFEYYDKDSIYTNEVSYKPTLYDILYYIKETFYITDVETELITLTRDPKYMWSIEKIKHVYPQIKEILEISEKLESIFSGIDMLTIPICVYYPGGYDNYSDEIFVLEKEEEKNKRRMKTKINDDMSSYHQ